MLSAILRLMMSMGSVLGCLAVLVFFGCPIVFLVYVLVP